MSVLFSLEADEDLVLGCETGWKASLGFLMTSEVSFLLKGHTGPDNKYLEDWVV